MSEDWKRVRITAKNSVYRGFIGRLDPVPFTENSVFVELVNMPCKMKLCLRPDDFQEIE